MTAPQASAALVQYATFRAAGYDLAIPVLEVQEVLRRQQLTAVPLAPAAIAGLINLRGQIVPALDMRRLLQAPEEFTADDPISVVLRTATGPVSLQVDEIGDVVEIERDSLAALPAGIEPQVRRCLAAVCQLRDRLLLVLDTGPTVDVSAAYVRETGRGTEYRKEQS